MDKGLVSDVTFFDVSLIDCINELPPRRSKHEIVEAQRSCDLARATSPIPS